MKFALACFRTTTELGVKKREHLGGPDRVLPLDEYEIFEKGKVTFLKDSCCPDRSNRCNYCMKWSDNLSNIW